MPSLMTIDLICRTAALSVVAWILFWMFAPGRKAEPVRVKDSAEPQRSTDDSVR